MINILKPELCCGCAACVQRCPKHCIVFYEDAQGFLYPRVDKGKCIDCGLCEKVCPIINKNPSVKMPEEVIAYKNMNDDIRKSSSSGGFFTAIAEKIISQDGVVFGARFDEHWNVVHDYTETQEGLPAFRMSKYVQSKIGDTFRQTEAFLKNGRKVLFTGTPCQISALHLFLRKSYENLYTLDFVCHGVPSPGVFRWYLQEELNKVAYGDNNSVSFPTIHSIPKEDVHCPDGLELKSIRFRDKCTGWKKYSFALDFAKATAAGEKIQFMLSTDLSKHPFLNGFINDLYLRPSCYKCPSKSLSSNSDFTVADFWGQENSFPEFDNNTGVSAVFANTPKSKCLINELQNSLIKHIAFNVFYSENPSLCHSVNLKRRTIKFWKYYGKYSFTETIQMAIRNDFIDILIKAKHRLFK